MEENGKEARRKMRKKKYKNGGVRKTGRKEKERSGMIWETKGRKERVWKSFYTREAEARKRGKVNKEGCLQGTRKTKDTEERKCQRKEGKKEREKGSVKE